MIRFLPLVLLLFLFPGSAQAACGVPPAQAVYETPTVQVYKKKQKLIGCYRPTGKSLGIGENLNDGIGTDESYNVLGVLGGRFVHTQFYATAAESADVRMDHIIDLSKDNSATAPELDSETDNDVVTLPGTIVTAGQDGVVLRTTEGHYEVLSPTPADALAVAGSRLYWRDAAGVHTTVLTLPAADARRSLPRARTIGKCKPRPGARLIVRDTSIVVTRAGGATWACRRGKTRQVTTSLDASILSDRFVAYSRPGFAGILDVANGKRRELPSAGGPVVASAWALVATAADGVRSWTYGSAAAALLNPGPATEVAIGETDTQAVAYWLDAASNPQSAAIN